MRHLLVLNDVIETGKAIGTASNQMVLGILIACCIAAIVALAGVVVYLFRSTDKKIEKFLTRMDAKDADMSGERRARIDKLMAQAEKETEAKFKVAEAIEHNTKALEANTKTIEQLQKFIELQTGIIQELIGKVVA